MVETPTRASRAIGRKPPTTAPSRFAMSDEQAKPKKQKGCPECGSTDDWGGASWCPNCGYYPAAKQQVVVPPSMDEEAEFENWWEVIPSWVCVTAAGIGALFVVSIAVRVMFPEGPIRFVWTAAQMGIGLIAMCTAHVMAYFYAVGRTDKLGPLDMFLQPLATWQPALRDLPGSSNLVCTLGCSIAALFFGFFIVDGIDYVAIMQADVEQRKQAKAEQDAKDAKEGKRKTSAMGYLLKGATTVAAAQNAMNPTPAGPPPQSLEEALSSFTGAAPITGDGTMGSLASGGLGGLGAGGFGDPVSGLTSDGGIDVNAFMQQQQAIASGAGGWSSEGTSMNDGLLSGSNLGTQPDSSTSQAGSSPSGVRRPTHRNVAKSNDRNVRLPSSSGTGSEAERPTSPVSTSSGSGGSHSPAQQNDVESPTVPSQEVECLVLGYTTSIGGEIRSLLLAAAPDRELLRFVAKVPVEDVDADVLNRMTTHFLKIPQRRSLVRCPYGGNWVKPEVFCIAAYDGWTGESRLSNPRVVRLIDVERP